MASGKETEQDQLAASLKDLFTNVSTMIKGELQAKEGEVVDRNWGPSLRAVDRRPSKGDGGRWQRERESDGPNVTAVNGGVNVGINSNSFKAYSGGKVCDSRNTPSFSGQLSTMMITNPILEDLQPPTDGERKRNDDDDGCNRIYGSLRETAKEPFVVVSSNPGSTDSGLSEFMKVSLYKRGVNIDHM